MRRRRRIFPAFPRAVRAGQSHRHRAEASGFVRAPLDRVRYVQDRIVADADDVWGVLGDPDKDAHIYVCGDGARMAPAVRGPFVNIRRARTVADEGRAPDWLNGLT